MKNLKTIIIALAAAILVLTFASCKKDPQPVIAKTISHSTSSHVFDTTTVKSDSVNVYLLDVTYPLNYDTAYDITYGCSFITIDTLGNAIDSIHINGIGWNEINTNPTDSSLRANIIPLNNFGNTAIRFIVSGLKVRKNEKTILKIKDFKGIMCVFEIGSQGVLGDPIQHKTHTIGCLKNNTHNSQIFLFN